MQLTTFKSWLLVFCCHTASGGVANAAPQTATAALNQLEQEQYADLATITQDHESPPRTFAEVMADIFAEFAFDLQEGAFKNFDRLAIARVHLNAALPAIYQRYVELSLIERIQRHSKTRVTSCEPCQRLRRSGQAGDLTLTHAPAELAQLNQIANLLGVGQFLDVMIIYQGTYILAAMQIIDTTSNDIVWARTYDSRTLRSRFLRLGVDFSQIQAARSNDDYQADMRYLFGVGFLNIKNIAGTSDDNKFVDLQMRSGERIKNRRHEFGLTLDILANLNSGGESTATNATDSTTDSTSTAAPELEPLRSLFGVGLFYTYNFLRSFESYQEIRQGIGFGAGVWLGSGYFTSTANISWDIHIGRSYTVRLIGQQYAASRMLKQGSFVDTPGGSGYAMIFAYNL